MTRTLYDDDDKLAFLDALPDNWNTAPLASDLNAGEDWSLEIVAPFDLDATESARLDQRAIGEPTNTQAFGRKNATGTLDYFRHYDDGQPDPAKDIVHTVASVPGSVLYLARREGGKPAAEPFAAGDEVSIWEVVVDVTQTPKEEGYRRARAPLAVRRFAKNVIVAADPEPDPEPEG